MAVFGETVFDVIENAPQHLLEVEGIGQLRLDRITVGWADQRAIREIMVFLRSHGGGTARAVRIYKTYGALARDILCSVVRTSDAMMFLVAKAERVPMIMVRLAVFIFLSAYLGIGFEANADSSNKTANKALAVNEMVNAGRYDEALPLALKLLNESENTLNQDVPTYILCLRTLGLIYKNLSKYKEAKDYTKRAYHVSLDNYGNSIGTLNLLNDLAIIHRLKGDFETAKKYFRKVIELADLSFDKNIVHILSYKYNLAGLYIEIGLNEEAERILIETIEISERKFGKRSRETLNHVASLAEVYRLQGRIQDAQSLYLRFALDARELFLSDDPELLAFANNGLILLLDADLADELLIELANIIYEKKKLVLGKNHQSTLLSYETLGLTYHKFNKNLEAEEILLDAIQRIEENLGETHPSTIKSYMNIGVFYWKMGEHSLSILFHELALDLCKKVLGKKHPATMLAAANLSAAYYEQGKWKQAEALLQQSTSLLIQSPIKSLEIVNGIFSGRKIYDATLYSHRFRLRVKALSRLATEEADLRNKNSEAAFISAQWALGSFAAQSITQMAARGAKADVGISGLVRKRQDLVLKWIARDKLRIISLGTPMDQRDMESEKTNSKLLATIEREITEIDAKIARKFPEYNELINTVAIPIREVQKLLRANEALILFLDTAEYAATPEETFTWVVTQSQVRWLSSDLGETGLAREVQALRCGLDYTAWEEPACKLLTGKNYSLAAYSSGAMPPFDAARSHRLYKSLLGGAEDLLRGKTHLMVVPSGALTQIPPQVLVTQPPADGEPIAWLTRDYAISMIPAPSSLENLRRRAQQSKAERPMIGFGNPILDGDQSHPKYGAGYKERAKEALETQSCPKTLREHVIEFFGYDRGVASIAKHGKVNPDEIRKLAPLPETADELCEVARRTGADVEQMRLGTRATEQEVKALSDSGELARYRVVHFATHALTAGELKPGLEPGLVLTPPEKASDMDDGYLTASEITGLRLDADWVILSACNTASGQAKNAEALSGLARAFFYAQARALLVAHWQVDSLAGVKLITTAMRKLASGNKNGRAEALRQSMLALIDGGTTRQAHPAIWAPFVVLGEGAR